MYVLKEGKLIKVGDSLESLTKRIKNKSFLSYIKKNSNDKNMKKLIQRGKFGDPFEMDDDELKSMYKVANILSNNITNKGKFFVKWTKKKGFSDDKHSTWTLSSNVYSTVISYNERMKLWGGILSEYGTFKHMKKRAEELALEKYNEY